jgi:hypothetical protein
MSVIWPCENCPHVKSGRSGPCPAEIANDSAYCFAVAYGHSPALAFVLPDPPKDFSPPTPNLFNQISNFTHSVIDFVKEGGPLVSDEIKKERLSICFSCEFHKEDTAFHTEEGKCGFCGCYLKAKASMATESCPLPSPKWAATVSPHIESKSGGCCNG